jgi:hypothetical protein
MLEQRLKPAASANDTKQDDDDGDNQQDVDQAAHGDRSHEAKQPENQQDDDDGIEHVFFQKVGALAARLALISMMRSPACQLPGVALVLVRIEPLRSLMVIS